MKSSSTCPTSSPTRGGFPIPDDPVNLSDLRTLWHIATQADLLRLLNRSNRKQERTVERFHQVEDALASRIAGKEIDTTPCKESQDSEGGDMNILLNSPTIHQTPMPIPPEPKEPTPAWAKVMMAAIAAGTILAAASLFAPIPPAPVPTPTPPAVQEQLEVNVTHGPGIVPIPNQGIRDNAS